MRKSLVLVLCFLLVCSMIIPVSLGFDVRTDSDRPLNYDAYNVADIYGYEPIKDVDDEPIYRNIESKEIDSFKQLTEPTSGLMDSAWPMYCHDTRHTGRSPYCTTGNMGFNKWWYKCRFYIEGSAAIDKDGIIYFGGSEGGNCYFYALYPNGTVKWKCKIDWLVESGPAIAEDGTIYTIDSGETLYAINPDGSIKWKCYIKGGTEDSSPAIGPDGTIYVGDDEYFINAVNPNGTIKWRYKTGFFVFSSPAIGPDGTVYCGSHDNYLYALYPNNGTLKWKYKTGHWIRTSPCIGDDGTVYCVSLDDYLHALYPNNGTRKWKTKVGGGTSPIIGQDGTIYCGWDKLFAVNPDGTVKWTYDPGGSNVIEGGTPCISADGTIYFGTRIEPYNGGNIIAVDSNGNEIWRERIATEWCWFAPVIGEDGTVYIGSSTKEFVDSHGGCISVGYLYAFNEKDVNAPSTPVITGRKEPPSKSAITYGFLSKSPLGNDVYYYIDWGDGDWNIDYWLGPYTPGTMAFFNHSWSKPGDYTIRCRCKDSDNLWSDWSEYKVSVPRNHAIHNSFWLRFLDLFPILERILALF